VERAHWPAHYNDTEEGPVELKWLEDFLSVAETRSFSRSAELRHVTQPAFSRRIRALETWLGADLIDRTSYPTRLTPAGEAFKKQAASILTNINNARALVRGKVPLPSDTIQFALPHALSLTLFPQWLSEVERRIGKVSCKLIAGNVHDAVMALVEGGCDLLMCYHHPQLPIGLDLDRYDVLTIGRERVQPYVRAGDDGKPLFQLPGTPEAPLPFLSYAPNAYLRRIVDIILEQSPCFVADCYETDMAEGLKAMALEGHGIAFLPESAVRRQAGQHQLMIVGGERWSLEIEIRIYRERRNAKPAVERLWAYMAQRHGGNAVSA
jgi:LysR family transcriptional regulator, hypochlorite-specific transcription factor HypT